MPTTSASRSLSIWFLLEALWILAKAMTEKRSSNVKRSVDSAHQMTCNSPFSLTHSKVYFIGISTKLNLRYVSEAELAA